MLAPPPRHRSSLALLAVAALAACNGDAVVTPAAPATGAGGGATTSTTSTSTTTIPDACRAATDAPGPHAFAFRMTNATGAPAFVFDSCGIELTVTACADGHAAPLAVSAPCSYVPCSDGPDAGCPGVCGACEALARAVTADERPERAMAGVTYSTGSAYCSCTDLVPLPAAKYRVRVPVWSTEEAARTGHDPAWTASVDFELPAPGGVVEVPVGAP